MLVTIYQSKWCHAGIQGRGGIAPYIIHFVLDRGEQVSSSPGRFNPGKEPLVLDDWVSRDSAVGIVTRLDAERPRKRGSISGGLRGLFTSSPDVPEGLWGPFSLLFVENKDAPARCTSARA